MIAKERRKELELCFYAIIVARIQESNCDFEDFDGIEFDEDNMDEETDYIFKLCPFEVLDKYRK